LSSSVFREDGLQKLSFEYVPRRLPHREQYVDDLVGFLRVMVDHPGALSSRVLICGGSGTGKTATARRVGSALESIAKSQEIRLVYAHVNCRRAGGKFGLVQEVVRQAVPTFPLRGYGTVELLHALWDHLNEHDGFLLLTLDEIDYYVRATGEDIVYELTRLTDTVTNVPQRMNFIFIARNHSFMNVLSPSTLSKFRPQERMEFPPYEESQLRDILTDRVEEAFREDAVSWEVVDFITRNAAKYGRGDARYAIQLLLSAGWAADWDSSPTVQPEHVREAQDKTDPRLRDEDIAMLPQDEKMVLLALARQLKTQHAIHTTLQELESIYGVICEEHSRRPVGRVLLQAFLKNLEAAQIITIDEGFLLGINGVRAEVLEGFLTSLLRSGPP